MTACLSFRYHRASFTTFLHGHAQKWMTYDLRLYAVEFLFFFSFPFSPLLYSVASTGLASSSRTSEKHHRVGQFLPWSVVAGNFLLRLFHSNFWAFSCIFQPPLSQSLWSGYHCKECFLLQNSSIDEVKFRVEQMSTLVTAGYGRHRSQWV